MKELRNILCIVGAVIGVRTRAGQGHEKNLGVNIDGNDIIYTVEQATFLRENGIEVADNDVIKQGILPRSYYSEGTTKYYHRTYYMID